MSRVPESGLKKISEEGSSKKSLGKGKAVISEAGVSDQYFAVGGGAAAVRAVPSPVYYKKTSVGGSSHSSDSTTLRDALRAEDALETVEAACPLQTLDSRAVEACMVKQSIRGDAFPQPSRVQTSKIPTPKQTKRGQSSSQTPHATELQNVKHPSDDVFPVLGSSATSTEIQTLKKTLRASSSSQPTESIDCDQTSCSGEANTGKPYTTKEIHTSKIPTPRQVKRGLASAMVSNTSDIPTSKPSSDGAAALEDMATGEAVKRPSKETGTEVILHSSEGNVFNGQTKGQEEINAEKELPSSNGTGQVTESSSERSQMGANTSLRFQPTTNLESCKSGGDVGSKVPEALLHGSINFGNSEPIAASSSLEIDCVYHEGNLSGLATAKPFKEEHFISEKKESHWDSSLPSSNAPSPFSGIDNSSIATDVSSLKNSTSANINVTFAGDDKSTATNNSESGKASEKGDTVESCRSSLSRASDSSGVSDDSTWSNVTSGINKPHKANDPRWEAIIAVRKRDGILGLSHFRLLKRLGCGDIGSVYLAELSGTRCYFAMKVMDKASLASRKKLLRAQTEREILQSLDHPFLPTLYTHFETEKFSCLVMEFCPGGDLHTLRQKQPGKHFSELAARFYAAEVLLALEYLHMLGVVYRDLKPENVLVREDGHIMLSDFDLSLRCAVNPTLVKSSSIDADPSKKIPAYCVQPACIEPSCTQPVCVQPSCVQPSCFVPKLFHQRSKKGRKPKPDVGHQVTPLPELIAEPTNARSMSFVGTHEYLAPEIIKGEGHGSAVDWWTFGIFLHELIFGKTPFKGSGNRATLFNVVGQPLRFPESPQASFAARDLIRGLLVKEPQHRLAYKRGATEIKQHPFFEGVNWALIRCTTPPDIPKPFEIELPKPVSVASTSEKKVVTDSNSGNYLDFDFF
eukprot:TRINITY_DN14654_c0_g1_i1.p1 TRINITY_DN14654_c0_g1~~TRINITY_DN14654_c0_g1_i1.p1  ORF type:complete len:916 (-),score=231.70 TRINITY_DN14654_c0_g1_i1:108-2855(-)